MNVLRTTAIAAMLAVLATGCSTTKTDENPVPPLTPYVGKKPTPPAPPPVAKVEEPKPVPMDPLLDPNSILATRSVYFEFDRSGLSDHDIAVVEAHGRYLVDHASRNIRVEGNCDERGGREYNLALGQRRANSVLERMKALGVAPSRVETVSLGKEKPKVAGHTESAWSQNRRADIIYK